MPQLLSPDQLYGYEPGLSVDRTWSPGFEVVPSMPKHEVLAALGELVIDHANPDYSLFGAVLGAGVLRTEVILGLHPSRNFGTPSPETCAEIEADIEGLGWLRLEQAPVGLRPIMGRRVGFAQNAHIFTFDEAITAAATVGAHELQAAEADSFHWRYMPGQGLAGYNEPATVYSGSDDFAGAIPRIGHELEQKRILIELTGEVTQVYDKSN